ncbi:hypothetical protein, partial [Streptomyces anulatus]|uniref:hypothetical protein n=1 Tax=Streptomyces anulatus TaxID=1892 RepID=UPI001941DA63
PALVGIAQTAALADYVDATAEALHDAGHEHSLSALEYLYRRFGVGGELAGLLRLGVDAGEYFSSMRYMD